MDHIFVCLHCQEPFVVSHNEFNCRILRHGVYKHNMQPIPPHASKEECEALVRDGLIFGCAGPLQIVEKVADAAAGAGAGASISEPRYDIIICDYI
jgi:hypothetical protein